MKDEAIVLRLPETSFNSADSFLIPLIDSIPALVASIDCNMVLQFCNQPFRTWFSLGESSSERSFPRVVGQEIFDQIQRHMGNVLVGHQAHFQILAHTVKGVQFLDATLSPHFDNRKNVAGFIFHSSDVTEKNRTERALKDYFENASIGLHWVNSEGIIIWANAAELQMLGYSEHEYIGRHISDFHADKSAIQDILERLSNKQTLKHYQADMLCKDGSVKHVSINSSVLWEGNRFVHTRCFTIDITEQKIAAKALKESEERFRMIANLVPLILWATDEQGDAIFLASDGRSSPGYMLIKDWESDGVIFCIPRIGTTLFNRGSSLFRRKELSRDGSGSGVEKAGIFLFTRSLCLNSMPLENSMVTSVCFKTFPWKN